MIFIADAKKKLWPEDYGRWTCFIDARNWEHAEQIAERKGLELVGKFHNLIDEETGEKEYIQ